MADDFIIAEKKLFTSIADCIRESKNSTETFSIASLGDKVKEAWGGENKRDVRDFYGVYCLH